MRLTTLPLLCAIPLLVSLLGCGNDSTRLIAELNAGDLAVRKEAIRELILAPNSDDDVISALNGMSSAQDIEVRRLAVNALGKVGADSELAREGLTLALGDTDRTVQFEASKILLKHDSSIKGAREVVFAEIKQTNPRAMLFVTELKKNGSWAAPALRPLINHRDESVQALAKRALAGVSDE